MNDQSITPEIRETLIAAACAAQPSAYAPYSHFTVGAALLADLKLANPQRGQPDYQFYVTDVPLRFQTIGERFLGRTLSNVHVVKW